MKIFIKWALLGLLLLGGLAIFTILANGFVPSRMPATIIAVISGSAILGLVFYLAETQYIPWRKRRLIKKLSVIFSARDISDSIAEFKIGRFDFLVQIDLKLSMSQYGNNEIISFHIPRHQIDILPLKPDFKYEPNICNSIQTYRVYQTNGLWLSLAKNRFIEKLDKA